MKLYEVVITSQMESEKQNARVFSRRLRSVMDLVGGSSLSREACDRICPNGGKSDNIEGVIS